MNIELGKHDDGMIGLGVLALLTIALITGQFHDSGESMDALPQSAAAPLIDEVVRSPARDIEGAIREFRIVPALINSAVDLGWSSDEELIDDYRSAGSAGF